jgi:chromosome partitioning protein
LPAMPVIAAVKRKGGAGASTLCAALAGAWHAGGKSVALLDADPQRSALTWAALSEEPNTALRGLVRDAVCDSARALRETIDKARGEAGWVLLDTPPGLGEATAIVTRCADVVLVPCGPSPLDIAPLRDALEVLHAIRGDADRPRVGLVPTRFSQRTRLGRELPGALEAAAQDVGLDAQVLPGLSLRVGYAESVLAGMTPTEWGDLVAEEAQAVADAVEELL